MPLMQATDHLYNSFWVIRPRHGAPRVLVLGEAGRICGDPGIRAWG